MDTKLRKLTDNLVVDLHELHRKGIVITAHEGDDGALAGLGHAGQVLGQVVARAVPDGRGGLPARIEVPAFEASAVVNFRRRRGNLRCDAAQTECALETKLYEV